MRGTLPCRDTESPYFPTTVPPQIFSITMHIIIVVKSCCAEYELSVMQTVAGAARGGARKRRGDAQVSVLQFWPAVARLGHLSIQEGPIGALITQAPVAPSGVLMESGGATPCA